MGNEEIVERLQRDVADLYGKYDDLKEDVYEVKREGAEAKVEIRVLCRDVQNLTNAIKWGCTTIILCFGGFFIWTIQQNLFK